MGEQVKFAAGDTRLVRSFGVADFPARLDRIHWGPYGEKPYWYVIDLSSGRTKGPIPQERIGRHLTEMEVIALASQ